MLHVCCIVWFIYDFCSFVSQDTVLIFWSFSLCVRPLIYLSICHPPVYSSDFMWELCRLWFVNQKDVTHRFFCSPLFFSLYISFRICFSLSFRLLFVISFRFAARCLRHLGFRHLWWQVPLTITGVGCHGNPPLWSNIEDFTSSPMHTIFYSSAARLVSLLCFAFRLWWWS